MEAIQTLQDEIIEISNNAREGEISHLEAVIKLRGIRKMFEDGLSLIKDYESECYSEIEQEAKEYGNEFNGHKFEFRAGRKMFSFKGVPAWIDLEAKKKAVEAEAKAAFTLYQKTGDRPITEDGELLALPEISYGKGSLVVQAVRR